MKKKAEKKSSLEKARSLLNKAEHANTPSSIKKRLKTAKAKSKPKK
jgi:hypothetical protein